MLWDSLCCDSEAEGPQLTGLPTFWPPRAPYTACACTCAFAEHFLLANFAGFEHKLAHVVDDGPAARGRRRSAPMEVVGLLVKRFAKRLGAGQLLNAVQQRVDFFVDRVLNGTSDLRRLVDRTASGVFDCRSHLLHTDTSVGGTLLGFARRALNELTRGLGNFHFGVGSHFPLHCCNRARWMRAGTGKMASLLCAAIIYAASHHHISVIATAKGIDFSSSVQPTVDVVEAPNISSPLRHHRRRRC